MGGRAAPGELRGSVHLSPRRTPGRGPARAHETGPWEPSRPALAYVWSVGAAGTDGKANPDATAGARGKPLGAAAPRCLEKDVCREERKTITWRTGGLERAEDGPPPREAVGRPRPEGRCSRGAWRGSRLGQTPERGEAVGRPSLTAGTICERLCCDGNREVRQQLEGIRDHVSYFSYGVSHVEAGGDPLERGPKARDVLEKEGRAEAKTQRRNRLQTERPSPGGARDRAASVAQRQGTETRAAAGGGVGELPPGPLRRTGRPAAVRG